MHMQHIDLSRAVTNYDFPISLHILTRKESCDIIQNVVCYALQYNTAFVLCQVNYEKLVLSQKTYVFLYYLRDIVTVYRFITGGQYGKLV